jgi:hypothetical protein
LNDLEGLIDLGFSYASVVRESEAGSHGSDPETRGSETAKLGEESARGSSDGLNGSVGNDSMVIDSAASDTGSTRTAARLRMDTNGVVFNVGRVSRYDAAAATKATLVFNLDGVGARGSAMDRHVFHGGDLAGDCH